jgi:hypothetical protein
MALKFGRLPNDPSKPRLHMSMHLKAGAVPPLAADYYSIVDSWGMLGNDTCGDCVFAANGHIVEQQTAIGQGTEARVSASQVLTEYARAAGFSPDDPSTDNGATIQDGLNDLRKNGLATRKIAAFAELAPVDMTTVKLAVADLGAVDAGVNFPASAMTQFDNGEPWDVVTDDGGILGGHCVLLVGYDPDYLYVVTWGRVQKVTYQWWSKYTEETWAIVDQDWVSQSTGKDTQGIDLSSLGEEFSMVTGQPNPFPAPAPVPPAPQPGPVPPPPPHHAPSWFVKWLEDFLAWLQRL